MNVGITGKWDPEDMVARMLDLGTIQRCADWYGVSVEEFANAWIRNRCEDFIQRARRKGLVQQVAEEKRMVKSSKIGRDMQYSIAFISDLHFGSIYQDLNALNQFIQLCHDRGIETLLCAGDITEGLMPRPGHKNERTLHTIDDIEAFCVDNYPDGFKNSYFIIGNHDESIRLRGDGYDIGLNLVKDRPDLTYVIGDPSVPATVIVDGGVGVQLYHGNGGCTVARTNRMMLRCRSLMEMGHNFQVLAAGHCHNSSYIPSYMGAVLIGLPSFQRDTPYLAAKGLVPECGGVILNYNADNGIITQCAPEFIFFK
ncbi:MAG TPA: metallophosphoesterase family protein [Methanothrix sp.]|nr:metallophosphoesterase [Methanothrix sp.]HOL44094.1 metallophosphoesterase family protein [Methanothrix sp.]